MRAGKALYADCLILYLLYRNAPLVCAHLACTVKPTFVRGKIPASLHKDCDMSDFDNYHPVSLLLCLAKVRESKRPCGTNMTAYTFSLL